MALRTENGDPIVTEPQWLSFFIEKMNFPPKSSSEYAKYLVQEGFNGDDLEGCIEDDDMKENLGMLMGEYKRLKRFIKSSNVLPSPQQSASTRAGPISKIPRPAIKMDSTQLEFDQFVF